MRVVVVDALSTSTIDRGESVDTLVSVLVGIFLWVTYHLVTVWLCMMSTCRMISIPLILASNIVVPWHGVQRIHAYTWLIAGCT